MPLAVGDFMLSAFGGEKILAIMITTLVPLVFLISMDCPCLCNDDIKYDHAHNRHNRRKGGREHVK